VVLGSVGRRRIRAVTHLDLDDAAIEAALSRLRGVAA
jgi:hypothetical protein